MTKAARFARKGGIVWLAGPAAALLFTASLVGFAAARTDGYSHATKAVSELGVVGAPHAVAFNLLGFILPGLLVAAVGVALRRRLETRTGPALLAASGLLYAAAGVYPADMADRGSALTLAHLAAAMLSGVTWASALFIVVPYLRSQPGLTRWGRLTPWFVLFPIANIGWQGAYQATGLVMPGWGQRIAFAGFFLWFAVTGFLLWRRDRAATA